MLLCDTELEFNYDRQRDERDAIMRIIVHVSLTLTLTR